MNKTLLIIILLAITVGIFFMGDVSKSSSIPEQHGAVKLSNGDNDYLNKIAGTSDNSFAELPTPFTQEDVPTLHGAVEYSDGGLLNSITNVDKNSSTDVFTTPITVDSAPVVTPKNVDSAPVRTTPISVDSAELDKRSLLNGTLHAIALPPSKKVYYIL